MNTTTDTANPDPVTTAANTAWLEYAKGTWSETDRRIFIAGWQAAVQYAGKKPSEGIEHLDGEEEHGYPNFSSSGMPLG